MVNKIKVVLLLFFKISMLSAAIFYLRYVLLGTYYILQDLVKGRDIDFFWMERSPGILSDGGYSPFGVVFIFSYFLIVVFAIYLERKLED